MRNSRAILLSSQQVKFGAEIRGSIPRSPGSNDSESIISQCVFPQLVMLTEENE